jgi:hypothetical protein
MFGCETSLVDIILNSLLADMTSSAPGKGADKLGGRREGHIRPVSRLPRHHCDKSHKGNNAAFYHTHTYIHPILWNVDPDPDSQSRSGPRRAKITHKHRKKFFS